MSPEETLQAIYRFVLIADACYLFAHGDGEIEVIDPMSIVFTKKEGRLVEFKLWKDGSYHSYPLSHLLIVRRGDWSWDLI